MVPSVILSVKITKYLRKYEELEGVKPEKVKVAESRSNTPSDVKLEPRSWNKPTENQVAPAPLKLSAPSPEPELQEEFKFKYGT